MKADIRFTISAHCRASRCSHSCNGTVYSDRPDPRIGKTRMTCAVQYNLSSHFGAGNGRLSVAARASGPCARDACSWSG